MKRSFVGLATLLLALFIIDNWAAESLISPPSKKQVSKNEIKIMTYNLENLFDTEDDPLKNDETYLPIAKKKSETIRKKCLEAKKSHWVKQCLEGNWTKLKVRKKMHRLSMVINSYRPDILFVQEVENINILKELNDSHLGFTHVILLEGEDSRGIDSGILTNLEIQSDAKIYSQKTKRWRKDTRGILEVTVLLPDRSPLTLYAVHFPSQGSPSKARENGLKVLQKISNNNKNLKIAAGDFNIIKEEDFLYSKILKDKWQVSHKLGCKKCKGTYYYHPKRSWSFFDVFLFSEGFKDNSNWYIDVSSIEVFNTIDIQNTKFKTPARFNDGIDKNGVSDHWPLVVSLKSTNDLEN
jgi:exonuclease III